MNLKEYQGKVIFSKYDINVPKGYIIRNINQIKEPDDEVVLKVQLETGGRGKAGGIKIADKDNIKELANELLNKIIKDLKVTEILIEEKLNIEKELYLSLTINRSDKCITLIFSEQGGIDIESVPENEMTKMNLCDESDIILKNKEIENIAKKLFRIMKDYNAELVEINPLVLSNNKYVAADSKIVLDDNIEHPEYKQEAVLTEIEKKAKQNDLQYVELEGDIAIIGNGAGLVMATLDVLNHFGGSPANFLDIGGGATVEKMEKAIEITLMKKTKGIFINIFGGITRCDEIAQGLVNYIQKNNIDIPFVVRMIGTNEKKAKEILKSNNINSLDSMEDCAKKIVELTK